jgi:hypothetical protein
MDCKYFLGEISAEVQNLKRLLFMAELMRFAGYVSYLAACDMNQSFSEYILYEPALRILTARGWTVQCEFPCPGYTKQRAGASKRLDFVCTGKDGNVAIEMKWKRASRMNVALDIEKLRKYIQATERARGFLFVFGRKSDIENLQISISGVFESGSPIYAEFGVTRFGCRNFEVMVDV